MMQTTTAKPIKVYVAVKTDFAADGTMLPREITWEDGQRFEIDRILDIRQAAAMKAGGQGDRYTVRIRDSKAICFLSEVQTWLGTISDDGLWSVVDFTALNN